MKNTFVVLNLATEEEETYMIPKDAFMSEYTLLQFRIKCLVTSYLIGNNRSSQVHNPMVFNSCINMIVLGKHTAGLGDYAVKLRD